MSMPHLTFPIGRTGMALDLVLWLEATDIRTLQAIGLPLPHPVRVRALVDTGSDMTGVASRVFSALGIPPCGQVSSQTASGGLTVNKYRVSLNLYGPGGGLVPMLGQGEWEVMELPLPPIGFEAMIGLDLLSEGLLILDGAAKQFTLGF